MAPKILIVDDEADLREIIAFDLNLQGFQTVEAENGKLAFEICRETEIDLIISDLRMPGGDGMQLLHEVKKRDPWSPPVLLITGFSDVAAEEAYAAGAAGLLSKPFERAEILRAVKRCLLPVPERIVSAETPAPGLRQLAGRASSFESLKKGLGGFLLEGASEGIRIGDAVEFRIKFETQPQTAFEGAGTIRVASEDGLGIEIDSLTPDSRKRYLDWLGRAKPMSYIPTPRSSG